jgi:hypothetical protein
MNSWAVVGFVSLLGEWMVYPRILVPLGVIVAATGLAVFLALT